MGVSYDRSRGKFVVRWTADGKRRTRRFDDEAQAQRFFLALDIFPVGRPGSPPSAEPAAAPLRGDGIYRYETKDGPRWRFVFVQSDGTRLSRRGFTSRSAAKMVMRLGPYQRERTRARRRCAGMPTRPIAPRDQPAAPLRA